MKGNLKHTILGALLLVFGLLSLILFLTIPDKRLSTAVFWVSFTFAIPINYLVLTGFTIWGFAKKGESFIKLPLTAIISVAFAGAYFFIGALFMYLPVNKVTFPIIIYAIITVAFVVAIALSVNGVNYIFASEKEVKEKRLFIKMLEADVLDCVAKANGDTSTLLRKLAEDIRFSDPMSHSSLSAVENELSSTVFEISATLDADANADIHDMIKKADSLLKSRNNRCLMLK